MPDAEIDRAVRLALTGLNVARYREADGDAFVSLVRAPDYRYEFDGEVESRRESFGGFGAAIVIAVFGILAILVLEFRRFRGEFIVASIIPLGGIPRLLWLTSYSLAFTAVVGLIALIGIEIKNSILLVDFTNQLRTRSVPLRKAIEQTG